MRKRYIIKTLDGNRYETESPPVFTKKCDVWWLRFPTNDGEGTVLVYIPNIVCIVEKETDGCLNGDDAQS